MKQNRPASLKGTPTSKRLLKYVTTDFKLPTLLVVLCIIISAAAGVAGSMFLQILIDDYITPLIGSQGQGFDELFKALIIMGGIYYIGVVSTYIYGRTMAIIGQGVQKEIRNSMFRKMQDLPIKYFDQNSFGDIMSRYTNDVDTLRQMLSQSLPQLINCVVSCTFIFFAMLYTSPLLTLVVVCILAIQLVITKKISSHSSSWYEKLQNSIGVINGYTEEMLAGQKVVKVFCHEEQAMSGFNELNEELYFNATWSARYSNILMPIMNNFANIQYVVLALVGGALTVSAISPISLGALVAFLQLSKSFSMPIGQVSQQLSSIVMAMAGAQRIFALMDEEPEVDNGYVTLVNVRYEVDGEVVEVKEQNEQWAWKHPHSDGSVSYTPLQGDIRFYDVDFSYDGKKVILKDINLFAEPGQKLAFVGATGAGKTTITNLINRFYDIDDGKIRYDGINIHKIKKADLRRSLGIVLQDTNLFTGTIRENIRYGNLAADDRAVEEAAILASAHDFIMQLPNGYDTIIDGEGSGLSQGQKQLLSIARAAIANPPAMILDEATSSIDTHTEVLVQKGMDSLMSNRTTFVIAHRLSTIQNADAIMVMAAGQIIERGNHDELIEEKGQYHQLYTGALELE